MTEALEEWRTGDMTATLTHIAGLLESLPLDSYREALAKQVREAAERDSGDEAASDRHRRARRGALLAAVSGARDFITGMNDALAHNRAASRADEVEAAPEIQSVPFVVWTPRPPRARTGDLHSTFPGLRNVISLRREDALGGDDEPA